MIKYEKPEEILCLKELLPLLEKGTMTRSEIVSCLQENKKKWGCEPEYLFFLLNYFWKQGLLVDHDLYPEED